MRINSTVALTLILLSLMFGAGLVSAAFGFAIGHEALKGITQPDARPTSNLGKRKENQSRPEEVVILKEEEILKRVKARMEGKAKDEQKPNSADNKALDVSESDADTAEFPMTARDQGIILDVNSVRQQGGSFVLDVNLRNEGSQAVRFLYSFLDVTDDQGRALSASTEGLPGELPPRSETFSGTVSIPAALVDNAKKISLKLTDYPNQQLQLRLSDIPMGQ